VANAASKAGVERLDAIVVCRDTILTRRAYSLTPHIKNKLSKQGVDVNGAFSIDIANYCTGFAHASNIANLMVQSGQVENVAVVASSNYRDLIIENQLYHVRGNGPFDVKMERMGAPHALHQFSIPAEGRNLQSSKFNSFLWGCGAGAVVISASDKNYSIGSRAESNHQFNEDNFGMGEIKEADKSFCILDGKSIYKYAISEIPNFIGKTTQSLGLDIKTTKFVPHQPQPRMLDRLSEKVGIPRENLLTTCDYLGNMIAASVPITYHLGKQEGKIKSGDEVAFLSFGDSYLTASMFAFREAMR
jgi:3-oxoacyl-[acyl-carrier-protein] synthase III